MKITQEWLDKWDACEPGQKWFWAQEKRDHLRVVEKLIKEKRLGWANWVIVRGMTRKHFLAYAIYAARQVLDIFEKKYPGDNRPRAAIEAAETCLKKDTPGNRAAAGAAGAAGAAREAVWAAWAAGAAVGAAALAAWAAGAAAGVKMQLKILFYGLKLLKRKVEP